MMETDIASEELVKQFLLPQSIMSPGDVFGASPTPDLDSIHRATEGTLEGLHESLKLESPTSPENDILNIATSQVGLGNPNSLDDNVIAPQPLGPPTCLTGPGLNLNPPIFILNNQLPATWPGSSLLTPQRGLYLVVDKGQQSALTLPMVASTTQINTVQPTSNLITLHSQFAPQGNPLGSVEEKCDLSDVKEEKDDSNEEPAQPFDYSIFLNKLPPKKPPPSPTSQSTSSVVVQVMGDEESTKNADDTSPDSEPEDLETPDSPNEDDVGIIKVTVPEEQIFKCDLCTATFNRKGNFTRHRMVHTVHTKEDFRYKCEKCERQFLQKCDLNRHMHIHNRTEPYRCEVCSKGYIRMKDLVIHMRFHSREKNMECPHCDKKFYQSGDLKRHVRCVHLKSKGLTCGHCQKKYAKEATLIRHMQTHHRDIILKSLGDISGKNKAETTPVESVSTPSASEDPPCPQPLAETQESQETILSSEVISS